MATDIFLCAWRDYTSDFKDLRGISQYAGNSSRLLLPMILVRNQKINILGGETDKITFGRIKYKFRTWSNKNTVKYNILVHWKGADFEVDVVNFMNFLLAKGCDLHLAQVCDRLTSPTPSKKNSI